MKETARQLGLKDSEYDLIVERLGREPNFTELGMFSVLWSEHCAYKHSKALLRTLPTKGPHILVGPGENAGVVDIGDGWGVAFKIESHNHPCAVEPYQGAATGIGGIVRDILAMGARPIALLDSLRFGTFDDPRSRYLFGGVVAGISGYGNCLGIPTVGGEVGFAKSYSKNPLCNVLCAGLMRHEDLHKGEAAGPGNIVMIVGHSTGRDGIHGCTFASEELGEDTESRRPNVQVGDPFMEKLLIEACLEMMRSGSVVGIQDMGAAGITSSCAETAARAGTGLTIDVSKVPKREEGMSAYEVMLSESQERMLLIVRPENVGKVKEIGEKWGLYAVEIGVVTDSGLLDVLDDGVRAASIPAKVLAESPVYEPNAEEPAYFRDNMTFSLSDVRESRPFDFSQALTLILSSPDVASKEPVFRQYDYMVRTDTVEGPGKGAAVIRVKGTEKAIALSTDCNGRITYLNPRAGAAWAVVESALNVACTGATPLAVTNCLNFGNPERPEIFWQFKEAVGGMALACETLGTPITGGNVSFYNETEGESVYPTPVIGMLGTLDDVGKRVTPGFKNQGDVVAVIGRLFSDPIDGDNDDVPCGCKDGEGSNGEQQSNTLPKDRKDERFLHGSLYLERMYGLVKGVPRDPNLFLVKNIIRALVEGAREGLLHSAQDLSEGGLAVALAESCIHGVTTGENVASGHHTDDAYAGGALIHVPEDENLDALLFGECKEACVVSFAPCDLEKVTGICQKFSCPLYIIGEVRGSSLRIWVGDNPQITLTHEEMRESWRKGLLV